MVTFGKDHPFYDSIQLIQPNLYATIGLTHRLINFYKKLLFVNCFSLLTLRLGSELALSEVEGVNPERSTEFTPKSSSNL